MRHDWQQIVSAEVGRLAVNLSAEQLEAALKWAQALARLARDRNEPQPQAFWHAINLLLDCELKGRRSLAGWEIAELERIHGLVGSAPVPKAA